ncbi:hypothetical protein Ssi02_72070 [Sinosporangium siamense]|uniref:Uncharacterized protein n=1 Tax=Sinosporangium siamense TaxID=1367973 RepID=A0A919VAY0_9ACTN|nr:hypothetical protein Ssi02_72070 [Sinosporangium siamense]
MLLEQVRHSLHKRGKAEVSLAKSGRGDAASIRTWLRDPVTCSETASEQPRVGITEAGRRDRFHVRGGSKPPIHDVQSDVAVNRMMETLREGGHHFEAE